MRKARDARKLCDGGAALISSSKSAQSSSTTNNDNRMIADNGATSVNSGGGNVSIHYVPDEAFDLANSALAGMAGVSHDAIGANTDFAFKALDQVSSAIQASAENSLAMAKSESAQLGDKIVKIGIPAAVVLFLAMKMK